MADIIATEAQAKQVGGSSISITANKMCTQERAQELGCNSITQYKNNRLVPLKLLTKYRRLIIQGLKGTGYYTLADGNPSSEFNSDNTFPSIVSFERYEDSIPIRVIDTSKKPTIYKEVDKGEVYIWQLINNRSWKTIKTFSLDGNSDVIVNM